MSASHSIHPVSSRRDRLDFLEVVRTVYAGDKNHVRLPRFEELARITPKNPYFEHAEVELFVARDAVGKPVGRISAQIDSLEQTRQPGDQCLGHFGFLEATDEAVMADLLEAAESWLRERGVTVATGPFSFSSNEETGLLIEGYNDPPFVLMNYAPPWYGAALEKHGYAKVKDVLAFEFECGREIPERAQRMADKALSIPGLTHRILEKRRFAEDIRTVVEIFNDAWSDNWGFVEMTAAEIEHMAASLKPVLPPELVRIVEVNGTAAGMIVILPDVNEAFAGLDGRLFPLGWAKVLWRLKIRGLRRARVVLMGVAGVWKDDLRSAAIAALLVSLCYGQLHRMGYRKLEVSWILEDNAPMLGLIRMLDGTLTKRYRIHQKQLK